VTEDEEDDLMGVPRYGRWHKEFERQRGIDRIEFRQKGGAAVVRPAFLHQPAEFLYDEHGYETIKASGEIVLAVRFTPTEIGEYEYRALRGEELVETGTLTCEPSDHHGYVEVSRRDPRYFALSDGTPYCAIGPDLCWPDSYALPASREHFETSGKRATLGLGDYRRWFRRLAENGGNYARLWASCPYFDAQTDVAGDVELLRFAALDAVVELARQHGIRLKLCLEHFRSLEPTRPFFARMLRHPEDGSAPRDMDDWFQSPVWQEFWWKRVDAYLARHGDDPTIMAWELWNEINCCATSDWSVQCEWTRRVLPDLKLRAPHNLVVNSIGSFDMESSQSWYDDFKMDEMDFQQVHRYLDQGAPMEICRNDPPEFSVEAIERTRRPDRPVLLAETGAVNDAHTGPFRYYRSDDRGIIFHDTTFPAFFAGAAGTGNCWHWEEYIDQKCLWSGFRPFADLVDGIQFDAEGFRTFDLTTEHVWFLGLKGNRHLLAWVRSKADSWYAVLRDGRKPPLWRDQEFDLRPIGVRQGEVEVFRPWRDARGQARLTGGSLHLPSFRYGLMLRISLP
jgi:hypothetical protein